MNRRFHIPTKINLLIISFLIFLVYVVTIIVNYARKDKIFSYEVKAGSLAESNIYTGIILRDEKIFYSNDTGYIDYFAREGEHLGVGDLIYTIDESGIIDDMIGETQGENKLTDNDLQELKYSINDFCSTFDEKNFNRSYDFLYSIDGMVLKYANMNILATIDNVSSSSLSNLVKLNKSSETGYIVYNIDGYESLSINSIGDSVYDMSTYEKEQLLSKTLIDKNQPVYKLITSENWSIIIPLTEEKALELADEGYVQIKFLDTQRTVWAGIKTFQNGDNFYGQLTLNNSVLNYCKDRYVDIELSSKAEKGLKIPISSLVYKDFYLIPVEYAIESGEENSFYFLRKKFQEDGSIAAELINVSVYAEIDGYYYVDDGSLRIGDYLLTKDSLNEYPVSVKGQLEGVYNMNKGYADFRQVVILYQNEEYAIVNSNTTYGLNEYDYIVLDSSSVLENDILYD